MSRSFQWLILWFSDPRTGKPVPNGLRPNGSFASLPRVAIRYDAQPAARRHKWQPHEAWIAPAAGKRRQFRSGERQRRKRRRDKPNRRES